ncbi:MAG: NAD-dependent epimerase/dehydratase [Bdellovibrionales bacterium]|nr:NAD-dependent epimerase/dehydratase [Bdellovibrionales bacterium]
MVAKKIVITGAGGFIGRHLVRKFAEAGHAITAIVHHWSSGNPMPTDLANVIQGSCNDTDFLQKTFAEISPDVVIHLASKTNPSRDLTDLGSQMRSTFEPAVHVAQALPSSIELALFFGSCEEYGNGAVPFREEQAPVCFSPYGWGKIAAHYGVSLIAKLRDLPTCWARPFLTFGPNQPSGLLIPTVIKGCLENRKIPLTLGQQTRDFLYVEDLCRMVEVLLKDSGKAAGQTINLCSGKPRTIRSVAEEIRKAAGSGTLDFGAVPYRKEEAMEFYGSPEKFERLFGKFEMTPFSEAIAKTVQAYRQ